MKRLELARGRQPGRDRAGMTLVEVVVSLAITGLAVWGIVTGHTFSAVLVLVGMLSIRKLAPKIVNYLNSRFNPWALPPAAVAHSALKLRTDEEVLAEFLLSFKTTPTVPASGPATVPDGAPPVVAVPVPAPEPAKACFATPPESLGELRKLLQKISATTSEAER